MRASSASPARSAPTRAATSQPTHPVQREVKAALEERDRGDARDDACAHRRLLGADLGDAAAALARGFARFGTGRA